VRKREEALNNYAQQMLEARGSPQRAKSLSYHNASKLRGMIEQNTFDGGSSRLSSKRGSQRYYEEEN
jgi:hypothetical protein